MFKLLICISISILFISIGCQKTDPVSVQPTESGPEQIENKLFKKAYSRGLTVMTRNVYVGTTTEGIMMAQNPEEIPLLATEAFQLLQSTNFSERAYSLAREVKMTNPHLIGLQEISLIRTQIPGDYFRNPATNAEEIIYDYLQILTQALADYDLSYKVAGIVENFDVEIPMVVGVDDKGEPMFGDIRLTDFDVVLARTDVVVTNVLAENFQTNLYLNDLDLEVLRGFVALDAKIGQRNLRFVSTHLESFTGDSEVDYYVAQIQMAQAMELVGILANEDKPIIMVGDFNAPAPSADTYQYILSEGFQDIWDNNNLDYNSDGFTFGHDADLLNPFADFYERIDFVFTKNPIDGISISGWAIVVGDEYRNRTTSGLWPSDHGGIVAKLKVPFFKRKYAHQFD